MPLRLGLTLACLAMSVPAAIDEIIKCSGTQFEPALVEAFVELVRERRLAA